MTSTKKLIIATFTGLTLLSGGVALSAKSMEKEPAINAQQAIEIALSAVPGVIYEVELEKDDNRLTWEIELISTQDSLEYEFLIDANTGEVIEQKREDDHGDLAFFDLKGDERKPNQH